MKKVDGYMTSVNMYIGVWFLSCVGTAALGFMAAEAIAKMSCDKHGEAKLLDESYECKAK